MDIQKHDKQKNKVNKIMADKDYTPNHCPKCGEELLMESNEINGYTDGFLREVYCDNPDCDWQGGVEHYKITSYDGFSEDGFCPKCAEDDEWESLTPYYLNEGDDFDCERIYVGYECPECGQKEHITAQIQFDTINEGEKHTPLFVL